MKRYTKSLRWILTMLFCFLLLPARAEAGEAEVIKDGIYVEDMDISGKSAAQAQEEIQAYVDSLQEKVIRLKAADQEVDVTAGELGLSWANAEVVEEAASLGREGNIVERYKALKDLQRENKVYPLELSFDRNKIREVLENQCGQFNQEARDASLTRVDGSFEVTPGQDGKVIDEDASEEAIYQYLTGEWQREDCDIELSFTVDTPRGTEEELSKVRDVLGTFSTSYKTSGKSRSANVENGCRLVSGKTLYPGDEFSMYEMVAPFTADNGYYMAGSYLNGQVVDSLGGGICQVSTTLYNAVLLSELEVTERHNHSMSVSYVEPSSDAAIAESAGKDFRFVNNTDYPIYIEGITEEKQISFTIYGVETRPANREVIYESEVLSTTYPDTETVYQDASLPVGKVVVQSAHIGCKARLWKIVKEDGVEVSREQVNSSSYKMVPRSATVGVSTTDPNVYNTIMAAVATNNIDYIKGVAGALSTGQPVPPAPAPAPEQPAQGQPDPAQGQPAEGQPPAQPAEGQTSPPAQPAPEQPAPAQPAPAEQPAA